MTRTLALGAMLLAGCSAALTTPAAMQQSRLEAQCGTGLAPRPGLTPCERYACGEMAALFCSSFPEAC